MANRVFPYLKTAAPTVNDDTGDGYKVGDEWLDTTNDIMYKAIDVTAGAAIWVELVGRTQTQTLTNKTLTTPTIGDFTNAQHTHTGASSGGVISPKFEGLLNNGRISVTVASNNITLALKTWAGSDPSSSDPVKVYINGNERSVTSALSVTLNAGTQWFALGTPFAAQEQNFFAYLSWRAASSAVVIGFSRIPYATVYSDFSATTTNEKHGAFSTAPASTDDVVVVGRFSATLSAAASYNWSVPTFTSANLIQKPTYETEWMYWLPAPTGYSSVPTNTIYIYKIRGKDVITRIREQTNGTSNATTLTMTAPFTAQTISNGFWMSPMLAIDNGSVLQYQGYMGITTGSATMTANKDGTGNWTNVNGKRIPYCEFWYPIAA